jgi:hypothetical protein
VYGIGDIYDLDLLAKFGLTIAKLDHALVDQRSQNLLEEECIPLGFTED